MIISSLQKGLVGHWPLDEQSFNPATKRFTDKTPNENHGTGNGTQLGGADPGFQTDRMGQLVRACPFNGSNDNVRIPDSESLNPINAMTAMVWVKGVAQNNKGILGHYDDNGQGSFLLFSDDATYSRVSVFISDNGSWDVAHRKYYISSIAAFDSAYHLIGFTFNAGTLKLFIDGVEDTNPTKTHDDAITTIHDSTADVMLGCYLDNNIPTDFFSGDLSGAKIWNRALSAEEWLLAYESYRPKIAIEDINKGLVGHWPLDRESLQSATIFADKTPNENRGISANAPVFTTDRMGNSDRAMVFNGTSDYVDCGDGDIFSTNYFISFWIYPSSIITDRYVFDGISGDKKAIVIGYQDGYINFWSGSYPTGNAPDTQIPVSANEWQHIVMGTDGTKVYGYKNSLKVVEETGGWTHAGATGLRIGRIGTGASIYFNGSIADVRIYNRRLSEIEITSLYEEYRPKLSMGSLMKGLVLDMPLNTKRHNAGNSKFDDLTPYENRGTNTGGDVDTDHTTFIAANSDNVRIPDSESLSPTSAMSAMCWVKGEEQQDKGCIGYWDYGANQRSYDIGTNSLSAPYNKLRIAISDNGTVGVGHIKIYESSIVAFDNTWHLIGFSFDAGTLKLFVDGAYDDNTTIIQDDAITTIHNSTADVMIGCYLNSDTPTGFFNGDLSGAKIWNRALSAEEWLLAYDQTKGLYL